MDFTRKYLDLLKSLCISATIIILSIKFVLIFKPLYYFDIYYLDISKSSNLNTIQLKSIYNYLINYLSGSTNSNFTIPILFSSPEGTIHFNDVRTLLTNLNYILIFTIPISIYFIVNEKIKNNYTIYRTVSIELILISIIFTLPIPFNFDKYFNFLHTLIFKNNYWLFDPIKDPVINILPEKFFMHCFILIMLIILSASTLFYYEYKKLSYTLKDV